MLLRCAANRGTTRYLLLLYLFGAFSVAPISANTEQVADDSYTLLIGARTALDIFANDLNNPDSVVDRLEIQQAPSEGILRIKSDSNTVEYWHGGASAKEDRFSYRLKSQNGEYSNVANVTLNFRQNVSSVEIVSPKNGEVIKSNQITVHFKTSGKDFDHVHLLLGGGGHISLHEKDGSYTFDDLEPGVYTVQAQLADSRHKNIPGPAANKSISVTIVHAH